MRLSEADPVDVLKNAWTLKGMGVRAVHFRRPVLLHVTGEHDPDRGFKAQLFVQGPQAGQLYHLGEAPAAARAEGASAARLLAELFPGVEITEPGPGVARRTLVALTPPVPADSIAEAIRAARAAGAQVVGEPWRDEAAGPGKNWDGSDAADVGEFTGDGPVAADPTPAAPPGPIVIELAAPGAGADGPGGGADPDKAAGRDESFDDF